MFGFFKALFLSEDHRYPEQIFQYKHKTMKKLIFAVFFLLPVFTIHAQINALTETGDEVILYEDGTWKYVDKEMPESSEIKLNEQEFKKEDDQTFLVKSKNLNFGVWINPREWTFEKSSPGEAAEFQFRKKDEDLYAMFISEKVEIPIENLKRIAFKNARKAAPNVEITNEEFRNVNGIKVLMMQMRGTIEGMNFLYYGYYFSNENGTIQLLTYTSANLFERYEKDMNAFLNGLVSL